MLTPVVHQWYMLINRARSARRKIWGALRIWTRVFRGCVTPPRTSVSALRYEILLVRALVGPEVLVRPACSRFLQKKYFPCEIFDGNSTIG